MERTGTAKAAETVKKFTAAKEIYTGGIFGLTGILCGAFSMLGSFNPIGIACIMAFLGEGMQFYFTVLTVIAGYVLGNMELFVPDYAIAVLLCTIYGVIKDRSNKSITAGEKAISAFIIFSMSGAIKGLIEKD